MLYFCTVEWSQKFVTGFLGLKTGNINKDVELTFYLRCLESGKFAIFRTVKQSKRRSQQVYT